MKLNLLPTGVGKEKQVKIAVVFAVLVALVGVAAAIFMVIIPAQKIEKLDAAITDERAIYTQLVARAQKANEIISSAQVLIRDYNLADAMLKHSTVYPDLYDEMNRFYPSFFRVISTNAQPASPEQAVVNVTGVLKTYQQYADLMLAILKNPNVISVTRAGFTRTDPFVPQLTAADQTGRPVRPGEESVPDNPLERLDYYIAKGQTSGFTGTGGFGTDDTGPRGAMPDWSQITLSIVVKKALMTPDPQATLGGGATTPSGGGGGGRRGGGPGEL